MRDELTNLLPASRHHALEREYFIRLGVVVVALSIVLVLVASVLLLPTYVFLVAGAHAKKARLAGIESTLSSTNQAALSSRLIALGNDAATLIALGNEPSVSAIIRSALAVPRSGVVLSGVEYTPAVNGNPGVLMISGTAGTRDALRGYQLALQSAPFALSAALPVSAYAKDTHVPFTITVTLAP